MNNLEELHPISLVSSWRERLGGQWIASFSRYQYSAQAIGDPRERFKIPLAEVTPEWLENQLIGLKPGYELAIESRLMLGRQERHIAMIDFATDSPRLAQFLGWAKNHLGMSLTPFDSGRSFHAYGVEPISKTQWVKLMGLLLLANMPDQPQMVDTRWVGHRLLAGYSALRWSCNSPRYLKYPTKLEVWG